MTWATHGPQKPSSGGIRWRDVSEPVRQPFSVPAAQSRVDAGIDGRPQQDSNLRSRLRRPLLSPLSYGGYVPPKGYQPQPPPGHVLVRGATTGRETLPSRK
jgi:hypothetical protein